MRGKGEWLALLAGAALPLAFSPFHFFPLALVSLAVLFWLWLGCSAKRAALRGGLFGLGLYGVGVSWVFVSIYTYGGVSLPLSVFLTALFIAFMALFPALLGYVLGRFVLNIPPVVCLLAVFPAAWMLQEWVRGWFLTGFPWLSVGYSQIDGPLVGYAPVVGVYGISWLLAVCAGLMVAVLLLRNTGRRLIVLFCLGFIVLGGYLFSNVSWVSPAGPPISAALLQGNIEQDMKWLPQLREPTIDLYTEMSRQNWGRDLIIWPETALPDFYHRAEGFVELFAEEARDNGTDVLMGVLYLDQQTQQYHNAMLSLADKRGVYYKQHLVPFTEYLPMKWLLGGLVDFMQVPMSDFTPGSHQQPLLEGAGYKIGMSICYEDAFGEEVIRALPDAALLVNVSNDAWFAGSIAPHQHVQMAQMRAIEGGRPMLRATNTGVTAAFDHKGKLIDVIPQYEVGVLNVDVQPMQGSTPYVRVGNVLAITLALSSIAASWLYLKRVKRRQPK